uniref:Uncharacterized protein n=1 Tax=Anguilla anguilla TaxID=7936 RepID=A0A0E9TCT3_ANGAN
MGFLDILNRGYFKQWYQRSSLLFFFFFFGNLL